MQAPCSPAWETQPTITSSTSLLSMGLRCVNARKVVAISSWGWVSASEPTSFLPLPRGVRTASIIHASPMIPAPSRMTPLLA